MWKKVKITAPYWTGVGWGGGGECAISQIKSNCKSFNTLWDRGRWEEGGEGGMDIGCRSPILRLLCNRWPKYFFLCTLTANIYFYVDLRSLFCIFKPTIPLELGWNRLSSPPSLDPSTEQRIRNIRTETEEGVICIILMKNESAALSLLDKVCNSIQYKKMGTLLVFNDVCNKNELGIVNVVLK